MKTSILLLVMLIITPSVAAGPYLEVGLAVPLTPDTGYTPDSYGIAAVGYVRHLDEVASLDIGLVHRSLTGSDPCHDNNCNGDNAIEAKLRFEFK